MLPQRSSQSGTTKTVDLHACICACESLNMKSDVRVGEVVERDARAPSSISR